MSVGPAAAERRLRELARVIGALGEKAQADPLGTIDWLRPQHDFLHSPARRKLLRTGNQVGKTTVGLAECLLIATGKHPTIHHPHPADIWVICASHSQSVPIQRKAWDLVPRALLHPEQKPWNPVTGFGHHAPMLRLINGWTLVFKTVEQGGINLAGATIPHALFDEPPKPRVYSEVVSRLRATNGTLSITMTPINRDCAFVREEVEAGRLIDYHFGLTVENLTHVRSGRLRVLPDGTVCDAAWIERERASVLPHEVPIVIDGEWDGRAVDRLFEVFNRDTHVVRSVPSRTMVLCFGADHGTARGNQAAMLVAVDTKAVVDGYPTVYVLDEAWSDGITTSEHDADGVVGMLERQGVKWKDIDHAYGDIPAGAKGSAGRKGNYDLMDAIARRTGVRGRRNLVPQIAVAKMGQGAGSGSLQRGEGWLHRRMVAGGFFVHERCTGLIESIEKYDGDQASEWKHKIDALRYALFEWIVKGGPRKPGGLRLRNG